MSAELLPQPSSGKFGSDFSVHPRAKALRLAPLQRWRHAVLARTVFTRAAVSRRKAAAAQLSALQRNRKEGSHAAAA